MDVESDMLHVSGRSGCWLMSLMLSVLFHGGQSGIGDGDWSAP